MTRVLHQEIERCGQCRHCVYSIFLRTFFCGHPQIYIERPDHAVSVSQMPPDFCPLPLKSEPEGPWNAKSIEE